MLPLLLAFFLQTPPAAATPFAPLTVYAGTWRVTMGDHTDTLINRCTEGQAFYSCEQIVNGKSVALVSFTPAKDPNSFSVVNAFPNGGSMSGTVLTVNGDRWVYLTNGADGKPRYKTENLFTSRDVITFASSESTDGGITWKQTGGGSETRSR